MKKFLIIDGSSILFRAFYALPPMNTKSGKNTNAILGFLNILLKGLDIIEPTHLAVCFDLKGKTFRSDIYEDYKGNRSPAPDELSEQFPYIKEILDSFNYKTYELKGFEADDIAGTLAKKANEEGIEVYLLTGDRDYLQLVNDKTTLLYTKKGISELAKYDVETVKNEYGISPSQVVDLKALMGDKSDNIPGIDGVGEKTAVKLLKQFGTVENLYENIDELKKNKTNTRIKNSEDIAFISKKLAEIDRDAPIELKESDVIIEEPKDNIVEILSKYELNSIISRLDLWEEEESSDIEIEIIKNKNIDEIIEIIEENKYFYFKFLFDKKPYLGGNIFKMALSIDEEVFINDVDENTLTKMKNIFEDDSIEKSGYDLKEDIIFLLDNDIDINNYICDIKVGEYILNPTDTNYSVDKLSLKYNFNVDKDFPDRKTLKKSSNTWDTLTQDAYLSTIMEMIRTIKPIHEKKHKELDMLELYNDIELPLIEVLADMELTGVYVDKDTLLEIGKNLEHEIDILVDKIHGLAGEEFNINSTKQLSKILFEKLKLPVIKKTKTGYSTDIEVLEKLEDKHEIISYIINYRTLSKLKSTYVDGFIEYINKDTNRIHSNFHQTVTATGRLSSTDPNLQNIPVRTDVGRELRKIFRAEEGEKLIDADYSQIELRLLADISEDQNMLKSFKEGHDIHTSTASKVFEVPADEVTPLLRSRAKAVNFGIVYGISDYGLSQDLNISRKEAKSYIDNYFDRFSGVAKYMEDIVEDAKEKGYVETKFKRKRFLPELNSKNWNVRNFGERIALNMPIQGTAADIIKLAMIHVYNKLKEENYKTKLILQIHDELILEAPQDEVDEVKNLLINEMEHAVELNVPLTVEIDIGDSWYDTK